MCESFCVYLLILTNLLAVLNVSLYDLLLLSVLGIPIYTKTICFLLAFLWSPLKFLTLNVRGLRDKLKRTAVLSFMKDQQVDIVVLADTHAVRSLQHALK